MSQDFNYKHLRARKSRITVAMTSMIRKIMNLGRFLLAILLIYLFLTGSSLMWLCLVFISALTILLWWWKLELHRLAPLNNNTIEGNLASNILGRLPKNPSSLDIAEAALKASGGMFIISRFGFGREVFRNLAELPQNSPPEIWRSALELQTELNTKTISGSVLVLAIIRNFPEHEKFLAQFNLDFSDLAKGVVWHDHIFSLIDKINQPKRTGGIARDWSFGWTPTLDRFGRQVNTNSVRVASNLPQHQEVIAKMIDQLSSNGQKNIALIGADGVGKTTVVESFASQIMDGRNNIPGKLQYNQVVILDASALISAAPGRGELEQLVNYIFIEAYSAKNVILCLDNAHLFFEDAVGSADLSNLLLPILEAGRLKMILTIDQQAFLQISARNSALVNTLNTLQVVPANFEETLSVMQDEVTILEQKYNVFYSYQALKTTYELSSRYIFSLEMPGRAVKLLEMSAAFADKGFVSSGSVERAIEKSMNVKISTAHQEDEKAKLLNLESLIHQRMIGQEQAVSAVANALRRARAGVRNQDRPIGTFLFLGPNGVGKTELAKTLADVYFEGEDNMIRLDLNEYVGLNDVERLIADGADNPTSLTAQVMKKPFSVILLDEIEKAHPNVLTALLQVLDEGILRDSKNREVSFRDSIIIATSNAGAERIRELIDRGYDIEKSEQTIVDDLISSNQFRPEFLNRFDEITIFKPLEKSELLQIVDLIIAGVNKTLTNQKVVVKITDEAKILLTEAGYDPRLGARPMRRVVQKVVENTVARKMLAGEITAGSEIIITTETIQETIGK
ncbi:MAG: ATP-dependent Clp protease ATP-binding subunit [Candidatus Sacchiramonaceae bacterium]|nr:ATP-dependent Clp protease ATP-binding subunit [Candidatus Saccharimonadaceae bacterium]